MLLTSFSITLICFVILQHELCNCHIHAQVMPIIFLIVCCNKIMFFYPGLDCQEVLNYYLLSWILSGGKGLIYRNRAWKRHVLDSIQNEKSNCSVKLLVIKSFTSPIFEKFWPLKLGAAMKLCRVSVKHVINVHI